MANINKIQNGLIYKDNFEKINLLWDIQPNEDKISYIRNGIKISHSENTTTMTMPMPIDNFVFQANMEHHPASLSDIAGVTVQSITSDSIECQIYHDYFNVENNETIKFVKCVCYQEIYTFYVSKDGIEWRNIGNSSLPNSNRIGFFINSCFNDLTNGLNIYNLNIYSSNVVKIITSTHFQKCTKFEIFDKNNQLIYESHSPYVIKNEDGKIYLNLINLLLPINDVTLILYNKDNVILKENHLNICGGDVYDVHNVYEIHLIDEKDKILLNPNETFHLGETYYDESLFRLRLTNKDNIIFNEKILKIENFSKEYRGSDLVTIAPIIDGTILNYKKYISLPTLNPEQTFDFMLRIKKDTSNDGIFYADRYKFKIILI